jgi:hypothetical protein
MMENKPRRSTNLGRFFMGLIPAKLQCPNVMSIVYSGIHRTRLFSEFRGSVRRHRIQLLPKPRQRPHPEHSDSTGIPVHASGDFIVRQTLEMPQNQHLTISSGNRSTEASSTRSSFMAAFLVGEVPVAARMFSSRCDVCAILSSNEISRSRARF